MKNVVFRPKKFQNLVEEIQLSAGVDQEMFPKKKKGLHWYSKVLLIVDLCAVICFVTAYGPYSGFRDFLVTTALGTATHKYFAYVLYSDDYVKKIVSNHTASENGESTDKNAIKFVEYDENETYDSIYEEQVLKRENPDDAYKIIHLNEDHYKGVIAVIYQPERLNLVLAGKKNGKLVSNMAAEQEAIIATNCGPAKWHNSHTLLLPYNNVIADGVVVNSDGQEGKLIGMTYDNVLCLWNMTAEQAVAKGMKWAVEFGPYLVVNGVPTEYKGNGGYGIHPRTAIGQRQDGIILLVVIDGRGSGGSAGITMPDLTEIMVRYKCYNAANLDGGGSSVMVLNNKVINNPRGWGVDGERPLYNALIFK